MISRVLYTRQINEIAAKIKYNFDGALTVSSAGSNGKSIGLGGAGIDGAEGLASGTVGFCSCGIFIACGAEAGAGGGVAGAADTGRLETAGPVTGLTGRWMRMVFSPLSAALGAEAGAAR